LSHLNTILKNLSLQSGLPKTAFEHYHFSLFNGVGNGVHVENLPIAMDEVESNSEIGYTLVPCTPRKLKEIIKATVIKIKHIVQISNILFLLP